MQSRIAAAVVAFVVSLAPSLASAQPRPKAGDSQEPIPRELALALLNLSSNMSGAGGDILVGRAPDDVPPELLPPGVQVLGSTTQYDNLVIVLAAQEKPDSAIAVYEAHLLKSGWTKPQPMPSRTMRGFVTADAGQQSYEQPDIVCHGDANAMLVASYRRMSGSLLKVTYNRGGRYSLCRMRSDATTYRSPLDEAPVPILRAPVGAMMNEGGGISASSQMSFSLSTRLSTRLKVADVVTHYDKQMRDQGWTSISDGAMAFIAAHSYRKNDDQGRTWSGVLFSVMLPDSSQQSVTLQLTRTQAPVAK